ncbi:MAG: tRNA pseudouridine(38-40) synthase TruA [Bacteroidales bacterium]|nr:tRNA pseudouridine(38-40) synthase TruA [Bacteroidales bacterium]
MRYFIELSYNGTDYHGWQMQQADASVQEVLHKGLKFKMGLDEKVTGCGRTDTGVHARQFYAHFDHSQYFDCRELKNVVHSLNCYLPRNIAVYRIFRVNDNAHARFDAISRTYKYYIGQVKNPFNENFAWAYRFNFNLPLMNEGASLLLSYSDFTSFSKLHTDVKTNNCKIFNSFWEQKAGQLIFTIEADRFLRNMVRAIVGTLIELGREKITLDDLHAIIRSKQRGNAGMSVPAKGLFLEKVEYEWDKILPINESL